MMRKSFFLFAMPLLWWGGTSLAAPQAAPADNGYEFLPVALHASHAADYGVDEHYAGMAPINPEIILETMKDNSTTPPTNLNIFKAGPQIQKSNQDESDDNGTDISVQHPDPTEEPGDQGGGGGGGGQGGGGGGGQGGGGGGQGNGSENGNGGGNGNGNGNGGAGNGNGKGNDKHDDNLLGDIKDGLLP